MMPITVTNPEGRNVEFMDQRGPTCGLNALSFALEYLYNIKIPATADHRVNGNHPDSLRKRFKTDGKTMIGELYDAALSMAEYIHRLEPTKIKCQSVAYDVAVIVETLNSGGLCMVPFCVNANGHPDNSGVHAHWCVLQKNVVHASSTLADAYHRGKKYMFDLDVLRNSNNAIADVPASWWGKEKDNLSLRYYRCDAEDSSEAVDSHGITHQIKPGSVKPIPATPLSRTLAGKMLIFTK